MRKLNSTDVARVCHEANRAYCLAIGDDSQPRWEDAPEWQKTSAINGVEFRLNNPGATDADMHLSWKLEKEKDGWTYGPVKDSNLKVHPCMVDYAKLPDHQRKKDSLFSGVVDALK